MEAPVVMGIFCFMGRVVKISKSESESELLMSGVEGDSSASDDEGRDGMVCVVGRGSSGGADTMVSNCSALAAALQVTLRARFTSTAV